MPLTQDLGRFASGLTFENLPREAVEIARTGFIDTIATMIAGANDPAPQLLRRGLAPRSRDRPACISPARAPPRRKRPGSTVRRAMRSIMTMSAAAATSRRCWCRRSSPRPRRWGSAGARCSPPMSRVTRAWAELARRDPGHHHVKGWHPTGIFGAIGAGAACAALRRLDPSQATMAIALSASQAGGIMANFGTMTKPFHAGRASHAGLVSARLAELGFTAAADALEHPQGFLSAVSPEGRADRDSPTRPGEEWQIVRQGLSIKKYPACYCTHRALDAMLDLLAKRPLKPAEISRITVSISKTHSLILRNHTPQTGLEAKFSMEFAMAAAVISRRASLGEYTDAFVRRPEVQELMRRVAIVTNENYDIKVSGASVYDQVVVELSNGERIESEQVRRARGHAELPLGDAELFDKFRTCLDAGGARISPERLFERLRNLENISARELTAIG